MGEQLSADFREDKKIFWKEVNSVRKQIGTSVKRTDGEMVPARDEVKKKCSEYF